MKVLTSGPTSAAFRSTRRDVIPAGFRPCAGELCSSRTGAPASGASAAIPSGSVGGSIRTSPSVSGSSSAALAATLAPSDAPARYSRLFHQRASVRSRVTTVTTSSTRARWFTAAQADAWRTGGGAISSRATPDGASIRASSAAVGSRPHGLSRSTRSKGARLRPFGRSSEPLTEPPSTRSKRTISPRASAVADRVRQSANKAATRMHRAPDRRGGWPARPPAATIRCQRLRVDPAPSSAFSRSARKAADSRRSGSKTGLP